MSLTKSVLASHIKDLECRASEMAVKYSKALQYGLCSSDCLYKKLFIANKSIDILKRFYTDDKICTDCDISGTWTLTHFCGYIFSPFTTYECKYFYSAATDTESYINSYWQFEDENVDVTKENGDEVTGTYNISTDTITFSGLTGFLVLGTLVDSENCNSMQIIYDNPLNSQTIIGYYTRLTGTSSTCEWAEYCITEEEIEDLISQTREILGAKCSCN